MPQILAICFGTAGIRLGASDVFESSAGVVTGAVTTAASDTFDFYGAFGNLTIDEFAAGGGPGQDVLQLTANDFGSFAAVQAAMTQTSTSAGGNDVVIRLDASDSITLAGCGFSPKLDPAIGVD